LKKLCYQLCRGRSGGANPWRTQPQKAPDPHQCLASRFPPNQPGSSWPHLVVTSCSSQWAVSHGAGSYEIWPCVEQGWGRRLAWGLESASKFQTTILGKSPCSPGQRALCPLDSGDTLPLCLLPGLRGLSHSARHCRFRTRSLLEESSLRIPPHSLLELTNAGSYHSRGSRQAAGTCVAWKRHLDLYLGKKAKKNPTFLLV
jgi:hypothetical protein